MMILINTQIYERKIKVLFRNSVGSTFNSNFVSFIYFASLRTWCIITRTLGFHSFSFDFS